MILLRNLIVLIIIWTGKKKLLDFIHFKSDNTTECNISGRCSIIDYDENVICDIYAWPEQKITTYRTRYSGITKKDMKRAIPLESALSQISNIIKVRMVLTRNTCHGWCLTSEMDFCRSFNLDRTIHHI
jgi:DNA polymerase III epsilon subunit-like protein